MDNKERPLHRQARDLSLRKRATPQSGSRSYCFLGTLVASSLGVGGTSNDNGETHAHPCGSRPIKMVAVVGQAFRIHSVAALTLARLVLTRGMRERSATLGYKHRAPAFGSVRIV